MTLNKVLEEYRNISGYEGYYKVSNMGKVLSLIRMTKGRWDQKKTTNSKILKPEIQNNGYERVCLSRQGKVKKYTVHRLVAETFIDNPDGKPCVNHIDSNKLNNRVTNLEWVTYKENTTHAMSAGRLKPAMLPEIHLKAMKTKVINNRKRTHCKNGHRYKDGSYKMVENAKYCITCKNINNKNYRKRQEGILK